MADAPKLPESYVILASSIANNVSTFKFTPDIHASTISLVSLSSTLNPTWIALHPTNRSILFSAGSHENRAGFVTSHTIDSNGLLTTVDRQASNGNTTSHLLVIPSGEVITPNYGSSSVQSHVLEADGVHFASYGNSRALAQFYLVSVPLTHTRLAYQYGDEILIPDLGSDKVWRLGRVVDTSVGQWQVTGYIQQPAGSGPRHIQTIGGTLYTLHELTNTITQQIIPPEPGNDFPALIGNVSTLPTDAPAGAAYRSAELISPRPPSAKTYSNTGADNFTEYLYASNRNVPPDITQLDPRGDTIAVFATSPRLRVVNQVYTGLQQIHGMMLSDDCKYIAAAGLTGGGLAVFEVTEGGANLELKVRYEGIGSVQLSSIVWL